MPALAFRAAQNPDNNPGMGQAGSLAGADPHDHPHDHPHDQAWRLRALVASMAGEQQQSQRVQLLADAAPARRVPIVAICSGKGGVGKTNLAVNLSIILSQARVRTTLFDADLGMANADVLCGLSPSRRLDDVLRDSLACADPSGLSFESRISPITSPITTKRGAINTPSRSDLASCVVHAPGGFLLVPGAVGVAQIAAMDHRQRAHLIDQLSTLESRSDAIIIDTGAGIGHNVLAFANAADMVLVVVTPEPTSITDAYSLIKCLVLRSQERSQPLPKIGLVLNQTRRHAEICAVATRITACCQRFLGFEPMVIGNIREDPHVGKAVRKRIPVVLDSPRAKASRDMCLIATQLRSVLWPAAMYR